MRVVFFGSPEFAVPSLESIHRSHHKVAAVVTQPDRPSGRRLHLAAPPVKMAAQQLQLPVAQPESTRSASFLQQLASFDPEILVVVAYGEILRSELLNLAPRGAINLHASLLPCYRGAAPIAWAILQGESQTGVTTIQMNKQMDAGDILLQASCPIEETDTTESLSKTLALLGADLLRQTLDSLERNEVVPRPQDPGGVSFAPKLKKEDGRIDWNKPADWIARQIRAFHPWPGAYAYWNGILLKFRRARALPLNAEEAPSTIVTAHKQELKVACGEGTVLEVLEIQPENRSPLSAAQFISGYHLRQGGKFELHA